MRRKIIPYNPQLTALAKQLRQNMTVAEAFLWNRLKNKQMRGYDFDRQRPIDEYIVDFYCKDLLLAIKIDGFSYAHPPSYAHDMTRQERLASLGVHILRFQDEQVKRILNRCYGELKDGLSRMNRNTLPTPNFPLV